MVYHAKKQTIGVNMRRAIYAGSFDPLTNGHLWMIEQGAALFDELIVAIGDNPEKHPTFSHADRVAMIHGCVKHLKNVRIESFHNIFLIDFAEQMKATYILRGIRNIADYEFERGMRHINNDVKSEITTLFLMPPREKAEISSRFIKGLIGPNNWEEIVKKYVPESIFKQLLKRYPSTIKNEKKMKKT